MELQFNVLSAVIAAAVNMIVGMIWYSEAAFGKKWMELADISRERMKSISKNAMYGSALMSLLLGVIFAILIANFIPGGNYMHGINLGFWLWLGIVVPTHAMQYLYEDRNKELLYIHMGYYLVSFVLMGAVVGYYA